MTSPDGTRPPGPVASARIGVERRLRVLVHRLRHGPPNRLFDERWYLARYPEVAISGIPAWAHYLEQGAREGRQPSPLFLGGWYVSQYPEVARSGMNPLCHYSSLGAAQGYDPNPLFDTRWYLRRNPDVARSGANPLLHYARHGWREGRDPHPTIDLKTFFRRNPGIREAGIEPLGQFLSGTDMGRYVEAIDGLGRGAMRAKAQAGRDAETIAGHGAFNADLYLGVRASPAAAREALADYLDASRRVAPRGRPRTGLLVRRPLEGFHPLLYAGENPNYDEAGGEDPLAHYARTGFPAGRWRHEVIRPATTPAAIPAGAQGLRVAVHGHFHYPDLLEDLVARLRRNRTAVDLLLTTTSEDRADVLRGILSRLRVERASVTVVPNRGRDIGPMLTGLGRAGLAGYDVVAHVHGKRSVHVEASIGERWRTFLWEHLVGGEHAITDTVLAAFAADEGLGLVFPEDPHLNGWDDNRAVAEDLAGRMGWEGELPHHFDFPQGTMFWARPEALAPLLDLGLDWDDYPVEPLPIDGTMLHALERLLPFSAAHAGLRYATTHVETSQR